MYFWVFIPFSLLPPLRNLGRTLSRPEGPGYSHRVTEEAPGLGTQDHITQQYPLGHSLGNSPTPLGDWGSFQEGSLPALPTFCDFFFTYNASHAGDMCCFPLARGLICLT